MIRTLKRIKEIKVKTLKKGEISREDLVQFTTIRALAANDCEAQLKMIEQILGLFKIEVTTAINGHEATQMVLEKMDEDPLLMFDFIILDLDMPISNGFDACKNIIR